MGECIYHYLPGEGKHWREKLKGLPNHCSKYLYYLQTLLKVAVLYDS
jgi:hypothetical protein